MDSELRDERRAGYSEHLRCAGLIARASFERIEDLLSLRFLARRDRDDSGGGGRSGIGTSGIGRESGLGRREREMTRSDLPAARQDDGALEDRLQLAVVAWPIVR